MPIKLDHERKAIFEDALPAMAAFRRAFGRDVSPGFVAEPYAARELDLQLSDTSNESGADAVDNDGQRFEIKYRAPSTQNVDVNNSEFDQLVLVNVDDDFRLAGMWMLPVDAAKTLFVFREKFRKYQTSQERVKREGRRIR